MNVVKRKISIIMLIIMMSLPVADCFKVQANESAQTVIIENDLASNHLIAPEEDIDNDIEDLDETPDILAVSPEDTASDAAEELDDEPAAAMAQTNEVLNTTRQQAADEEALQMAILAVPANEEPHSIEITANIYLTNSLEIKEGQNIEITSGSEGPFAIASSSQRHFEISGSLSLRRIILDGKNIGGGVYMESGNLVLNEGAVIMDCRTTEYGGGVCAFGGNVTVNKGASISGCEAEKGGGIYVDYGVVEIRGGFIFENRAQMEAGGLYIMSASTVSLSDGGINGNWLLSDMGGGGGGVYMAGADSVFTMSGGEISDNRTYLSGTAFSNIGGGVAVKGSFHMSDGSISGNRCTKYGGGVAVTLSGAFEMQGGIISGNTAYNEVNNDTSSGGGAAVLTGGEFTMKGGSIEKNTADYGGGVYVGYPSSKGAVFTFEGGVIRANTATAMGGGIMGQYAISTIHLSGGIIGGENPEDANKAPNGGGLLLAQATANMSSGSIIGNRADATGGGMYILSAKVNMTGGSISNNTASLAGGLYVHTSGLQVTAGEISRNEAVDKAGGGIYLNANADAMISGAAIKGNRAATSGGGVFIASDAVLETGPKVIFIDNHAGNKGGGIYTAKFDAYAREMDPASDYSNLTLHSETVFSDNTASKLYAPPANADAFANLGFSSVSMPDIVSHPLNNFDINFALEPKIDTYRVVYNANDGTVTPKTAQFIVASGSSHYVKADTDTAVNFARNGHTFTGWNTQPGGGGAAYKAGDEITNITQDITLYAQWKANGGGGGGNTYYSVTYDANGGQGTHRDTGLLSGAVYTVKSAEETSIFHEGYAFTGWNTRKDGTGTRYAPADTFRIYNNVVLYAQWEDDFLLNREDHFAYIIGYPDGTLRPGGNITRSETATVFFRLLTEKARDAYWTKTNRFTDVGNTHWYNNAVSTMASAGIVEGYTDGTFGGDRDITRGEFAAIAARFDSGEDINHDRFSDISGHWAAAYINRAAEKGWIEGYEDGTFRPDRPITRAEAVTLINRVLERAKIAQMHADMVVWPDNTPDQWHYLAMQEASNSHLYVRDANAYEEWVKVLPVPNWEALEKR